MVRNEFFVAALDYLYKSGLVADQKELSEKTGLSQTSISRIINNKVKKPSDETIRRLNATFNNIFNPQFFRGESDVLLNEDKGKKQTEHRPIADDALTLAARLIESTEHLRQELHAELEEIRELKQQLAALLRAASYSPTPLMAADPNADYHTETTGTKTETNTQ